MSRLQRMTRTLERRAESIYSYFQTSLRKEQLQSSRCVEKIDHLEKHLSSVLARCEENEQAMVESKELYQHRVRQLETELDELRREKDGQETLALQNCQKRLEEQTRKVNELEGQLSSVRNASAKKDVKTRALERSISELRITHASDTETIAQLEVKLDKAISLLSNSQQEYQAATREYQNACDAEKAKLSEALTRQQAAVAKLEERLLTSEGALEVARSEVARYSQQEEQLNLQAKMFDLLTKDLRGQVAGHQQDFPSITAASSRSNIEHPVQDDSMHRDSTGEHPLRGTSSSADVVLTRLESLLRKAELPAN